MDSGVQWKQHNENQHFHLCGHNTHKREEAIDGKSEQESICSVVSLRYIHAGSGAKLNTLSGNRRFEWGMVVYETNLFAKNLERVCPDFGSV